MTFVGNIFVVEPNAIVQGFFDQMLFNKPRNARDSLPCLQNSTIGRTSSHHSSTSSRCIPVRYIL